MSLTEKIYQISPVWVQNLMVGLYGLKLYRERYRGKYSSYFEEFQKTQWYSPSDFEALQRERLNDFIQHAYTNVPYYHDLFRKIGIQPKDVRVPTDLKKVPILEKSTFRKEPERFLAQNFRRRLLIPVHTSGTTGTPMTVYLTRNNVQERMALLHRMLAWAGVQRRERSARFSGRTLYPRAEHSRIFWRYNWTNRQVFFSTYHMKDEYLGYYVQKLVDFRPVSIDGYPSALYILACWITRHNAQGEIQPKAILTTAETLYDYEREVIEKAFHAKLYNQYASSEGAPFITECPQGGFHMNPESGIFELLKPGTEEEAEPGEEAALIVTSFATEAMPLIRYRIGDIVIKSETQECPCGRQMPMVDKIIGRMDDILYTEEHGYVGRLDPVFKKSPNSILVSQIIQEDLHRIVLKVVPDQERFDKSDLTPIIEELHARLGQSIHIDVEIVDSIPQGPQGKLRAVVNKMPLNIGV